MDDWMKAKLAKDMPAYDPNRECPKCRGAEIRTYYDEGHQCEDERCGGSYSECFIRTCQRCHYQWLEAVVKDQVDVPPSQ